jgi:hypothetical protein
MTQFSRATLRNAMEAVCANVIMTGGPPEARVAQP